MKPVAHGNQNVPEGGVTLSLVVASPDALTLLIEDSTLDLPEGLAADRPKRPGDTMPAPMCPRDATAVLKKYTL